MATHEQVKIGGEDGEAPVPIEADAVVADELSVNTLNVVDSFMSVSETIEVLAGEHDRLKVYVKEEDGARLAFEGSVEELEALQENVLQAGMELQVGEVTIFVKGHELLAGTPDGKTLTLATLE